MDSIAQVTRFRQLKESIGKKEDYLLIGTDVSKDSTIGCFYSSNQGVISGKYRILHDLEGFQRFCDKIEELKNKYRYEEVIIGVEPTGNYHKVLCEYLNQKGHLVVYVSTVAAKNNRKTLSGGRWGKNDPRDAYNVVDLMKQGKISFYSGENDESKNIRNYLLLRKRLTKIECALKVRIRNYIWTCHFPELEHIFKSSNCPDVLTLLEKCPTADTIKTIGLRSFMQMFCATPGTIRYDRLINVWHCARRSIGYAAQPSVEDDAKMIARDMKRVKQDISDVDRKLAQINAVSGSFMQLLTMPGFGQFTTAIFKAVIGDINKFNHARQLEKLAGIDLEPMESGKYRGVSKISKKGSSLLRYAVVSAVNVATSRNKQIKAIFLDKLKERGNTRSARAKLKLKFAAKYIRIAYVLLKKNIPFDINLFNVPVEEPVHINVRA